VIHRLEYSFSLLYYRRLKSEVEQHFLITCGCTAIGFQKRQLHTQTILNILICKHQPKLPVLLSEMF